MEDYRLDQSGQEVQDILNGAAMQSDLTAETERATEAEQTLQDNIDAEATRAQGAEGTLQDNIDAEEARAKAAEKQNADDIDAIEEKIPSGASSSNKLATEEYVADAVATATATFRGTYNLVSDLHLNVTATEQQISAALAGAISTADNNDYCFILVPTSSETPTEIKEIDRYKFNGTAWAFEYKLNNSGFNAAQWAAINSGITSGDVAKLAALPTNAQLTTLLAGLQSDIDGEETRAKAAELAIQGNIDAEEVRAKAAEKQNADDIDAIEAVLPESASSENKVATESEINSLSAAIEAILLLIPSAATSLNKLADKAFVNSSIATATATFRGTYNLVNDLGLTTSATHAQIATALAGAILTADNNDYAFVQIPTSDAMPTEIAKTERYKFNGTAWEYEYDLNNSGFTADQWAAINSGITQALVTKLSDLPTNAQLTTELGTLTSSITAINQKIPNAASQANKLVDTAAMESYIVEVLNVLTISYNVNSTDGHVTVQISQVDGKITSVAVSTSDIASAADLNLKASQADLTALASRVTTAEGNITTLGGRMTTAEGNITSLGGRMTTAEGNITTINGNITSLGGRVSTNETDIANLQQLYNDLQQSKPVPVTALPETGQQQGVIYRLAGTTSYSDYMWNGSTWVLMATYNNAIDPRPKKASQNLVTSGGVFDNMGALDVSELNATENPHTLAKYVDLSAALAAIPTDYQKGGMSIKYVCSSDNKYMQYRLMNQTFSTTLANWQGVDDEPIANSSNLTKSGGVYKGLINIAGLMSKPVEYYNIAFCNILMNGHFSNEERLGDYHAIIPVQSGQKYLISNIGGNGGTASYTRYVFAKSTNYEPGGEIPSDGLSVEAVPFKNSIIVTVPENYPYLLVNIGDSSSSYPFAVEQVLDEEVEDVLKEVESLSGVEETTHVLAENEMTSTNMYMSDNGTWKQSSLNIAARYIPIRANTVVSITSQNSHSARFALVKEIGQIGSVWNERLTVLIGETVKIKAKEDCLLWVYYAEDYNTIVFPEELSITYLSKESKKKVTRFSVNLCDENNTVAGSLDNEGKLNVAGNGIVTDFIQRSIGYKPYQNTQYIHTCCYLPSNHSYGFNAERICLYDKNYQFVGKIDNINSYIDKESVENVLLFSNVKYIRVQFASGASNLYVALSNTVNLPQFTPYDEDKLEATKYVIFDKVHNTDGAIENMLSTALDYVNAGSYTDLGYGDSATAFDNTVEAVTADPWNPDAYEGEKKQINCSAFVQLCLEGVRFENSRYKTGTNGVNFDINGYVFDANAETNYHNNPSLDGGRSIPCSNYGKMYANKLLKYAYDRGFVFVIEDGLKNIEVGDVIFASNTNDDDFKSVGHCCFVSAVNSKIDGTKSISIMEVSGRSINDLAHETNYDVKQSTWIFAARFPLPCLQSDAFNIVNSIDRYEVYPLEAGESAVIGTLHLSENVKAKGIYTVMVKASEIGNFEIIIKSGDTILGSSGSDLYRRNDKKTIKHFHIKYDSAINTNELSVVVKAINAYTGSVEIESAMVFNGYKSL